MFNFDMDEYIYDMEQQGMMDLCYLTLKWQKENCKGYKLTNLHTKAKTPSEFGMKIFHLNNLVVDLELSLSCFEYILITCAVGP
jgi:hypothetical protein